MKRILFLFLFAGAACFAQVEKTRTQLNTEIDTLFPSGVEKAITAEKLRTSLKNIVASDHNALDDGDVAGSTATGRAVLTAADAAAARTAIGAGTSSFDGAYGSLSGVPATFAPSAHGHAIADTTGLQTALDGKAPTSHTHTASQVSDSTAVGRSVLTATDAAAARTAIGAGTSSFDGAYGSLSGVPATFAPSAHGHAIADTTGLQTALDGKAPTSHTHTASQVSDATAVGRSVLTAADAAAARTAIGAGTSSFSGAYADLTGKPALGTAAALDVPATGNAAAGEVVKGSDTRLTDSRTPTAHTHTASEVTDFAASARSQVESMLVAGTNITLTPSGSGATRQITVAASGGGGGWASGLLFTTASSTENINNSTAEASIFAGTVPGGTLGTTGTVRVVVGGQLFNNTGAGATLTLRIKYGSTTVYQANTASIATNGTPRTWRLEFHLFADNSANAQRLEGQGMPIGAALTASAGYGPLTGSSSQTALPIGGTAAEDSSVDKTLEVTLQASVANELFTVTTHKGSAWKL